MKRGPLMLIGLAALAGAVALIGGAASGPASRTDAPPGWYSGVTHSGATYELTVTEEADGSLCQRLDLEADEGTGSSGHCQPATGTGMEGMWALDCRGGDLRIHGTAYAGVASLAFRSDDGQTASVHTERRGNRRLFLLVADGSILPGRLEARTAGGTGVERLALSSSEELCDTGSAPDALEATYSF